MSRPESLIRTGRQHPRLLPLITVAPYVALAALDVVTVIIKHGEGGSLLVDLSLCVVTALWMLGMFTLHPAWRKRAAMMGLFFAGLIVLTGVLVIRDPWFGLFTPFCYCYAFEFLSWPWRLPGVAAVALVAGNAQSYGIPKDNAADLTIFAVVLAVNVVGMCGLVLWERDYGQKNEARLTALGQVREANRRLEATLAENAGLHQQLLVQAREAGVLDERQRMAREIHDTLAQGLTGIVIQLQAAEQAYGDQDRWRRHFTAATRMARESLAEARRSVDALRPQPLVTAGLGEALAGVADRWSAVHGVTAKVTTTGKDRPMRPEAELALLRAAQEALANVARHARASTVSLTLGYLDHEVTLDVSDDGRGFETATARGAAAPVRGVAAPGVPVPVGAGPGGAGTAGAGRADEVTAGAGTGGTVAVAPVEVGAGPVAGAGGGFGLKAMRERIEGLSGTLRIRSAPGSGTTISARVPHRAVEVGA